MLELVSTGSQIHATSFKEGHSLHEASKLHAPTFLLRMSPDGSPQLCDDEQCDRVAAPSNTCSPHRAAQHDVGASILLAENLLLFLFTS